MRTGAACDKVTKKPLSGIAKPRNKGMPMRRAVWAWHMPLVEAWRRTTPRLPTGSERLPSKAMLMRSSTWA